MHDRVEQTHITQKQTSCLVLCKRDETKPDLQLDQFLILCETD
jgi:hypothetical protein